MAGLLGFTLADLTGAVDSRKRQYGNLVRGLLSDPKALMEQLSAQDAEAAQRNRYTQASAGSVMPEVAQQGQQAMMDAALNVGGLLGITAYHGSPHTFDKFDMSKIGTGEGAQAYGHGLYFAENPGIARSYKDKLSDATFKIDGMAAAGNSDPVIVATQIQQMGGAKAAKDYFLNEAQKAATLASETGSNKMQRVADNMNKWASMVDDVATRKFSTENGGSFYKVDIPDDAVAKMLDWDKPLSQQPEAVRKALDKHPDMEGFGAGNATGSEFYDTLLRLFGDDVSVSRALKSVGIPGIRYLDAGSRGKGGTSNFVLFDDKLPKILSRE